MNATRDRRLLWDISIVSLMVIPLYIYLTIKDTPGLTILDLVKGVVKLVLLMWARIPSNVWFVFLDVLFLFLIYLLSLAFFSQFALPVRNFVQRVLAFVYMALYTVRLHRQRIHVENGVIPDGYPREKPSGFSVMVLDTASAALLRTPEEFTRAVGPGLVFTNRREYLAGAVDLHRVAWPDPPQGFGPRGDEDPFENWNEKNEPKEKADERVKRRYETSGETRDGVEVVPNIFVQSTIDEESEIPGPPWNEPDNAIHRWLLPYMESRTWTYFSSERANRLFNKEAVRLAITGEEINPRLPAADIDRRKLAWYQLPAYMAVDLWREYLRKFTFEELFTELEEFERRTPDGRVEKLTAYQVIQQWVGDRLRNRQVMGIDAQGRPTGYLVDSPEFQILQRRGIKVLFPSIRNLHFQKQVDQQIEDRWFAHWRWRADDEREQVDRLRSYRVHEGEKEALREFAFSAASEFDYDITLLPRPANLTDRLSQMRSTLEGLVRGTQRLCVDDTMLHQRLLDEEAQLSAIIDWLRKQTG